MMLQSPSKGAFRDRYPIMAYVGQNGSGKSLAMVVDCMRSLDAGRPCLSTLRFLDWRNPHPCEDEECVFPEEHELGHLAAHPLWVPFTSWSQLIDIRGCDVAFDEMQGVASSRSGFSIPGAVLNVQRKLRHRDCTMRWTAPDWMACESTVRRLTQAVTECRGMLGKRSPGRVWRDRRLFRWTTYDARDFDEWSEGVRRNRAKKLGRQWYWGPHSPAFSAYDTLGEVLSLATTIEGGRCAECGGRRSIHTCRCDSKQRGPEDGRQAPGRVPARLPVPDDVGALS